MKRKWVKYGSLLLLLLLAVNVYLPSEIREVRAAQEEITVAGENEESIEKQDAEATNNEAENNESAGGEATNSEVTNNEAANDEATNSEATNGEAVNNEGTNCETTEYAVATYELSDDDGTGEGDVEMTPWYTAASGSTYTIPIYYDLNGGASDSTYDSEYLTNEETFSITVAAAPTRSDGFTFAGWLCSIDSQVYQPGESISGLESLTYNGNTISFTAQWEQEAEEDSTTISQGATRQLEAGTPYRLGEGSWTVSGDPSVYAGGNEFYVGTTGSYTFTK